MKNLRIQSFSDPYFPSRIWTEYSRIQSECGKIRTRKTLKTDTFQTVIFRKDFVDVSHENASFFRGDLIVIYLHDFSYQTLYSIGLRLTNQIKQKFPEKLCGARAIFFKKTNAWEIFYSKKRRNVRNLCESNEIRMQNYRAGKQRLNHSAKLVSRYSFKQGVF